MATSHPSVACPDAVTPSSVTTPDEAPAVAGLAATAAAVTIALTAAAFWLSYEHLHDVAAHHGLQRATARAWAWPATVDLFIVAGELLILRASLRRLVDGWAIALAASGSLGSIALNVAGVGNGAAPLDYVVAAVPPVAALLAFGALMRQVHEHLQQHATSPAVAPPSPDEPQPTPDGSGDDGPGRLEYDLDIDELIRGLYDTLDARPTTAQMTAAMRAAGLGDAPTTARTARARIERREPHLRGLSAA